MANHEGDQDRLTRGSRESSDSPSNMAMIFASLDHELKTPLAAILFAVENLRNNSSDLDRRAQGEAAIAELVRLDRLFDDLVVMARIDATAIKSEPQWVTLADIVDAATAHARDALGSHALCVCVDDTSCVHVDGRLAAIALSRLLENASAYSPPGCHIEVHGHVETDGITLGVTDHGPPLKASELDHLFEPFHVSRHVEARSPGRSIGLAVAQGLVNFMGGRVWATDAAETGVSFAMFVPGPVRPAHTAP